jgi:pimeloyl-ACP methyl ester carboxylesterase
MIVALLPGFARDSALLAPWCERLPGQVRLFDLPGHNGEPPLGLPSLEALAEQFARRIPPGSWVIGESLGGLAALKLAAQGYRAIAIDPPLSVAKVWTLQRALPAIITQNPSAAWMPDFVDAIFGVRIGRASQDRNYWPLLDDLTHPVDIVGASLDLWPVHNGPLQLENLPSVLDAVDAYQLSQRPNVRFQRVAGPHTLLTNGADALQPVLLEILNRSCA